MFDASTVHHACGPAITTTTTCKSIAWCSFSSIDHLGPFFPILFVSKMSCRVWTFCQTWQAIFLLKQIEHTTFSTANEDFPKKTYLGGSWIPCPTSQKQPDISSRSFLVPHGLNLQVLGVGLGTLMLDPKRSAEPLIHPHGRCCDPRMFQIKTFLLIVFGLEMTRLEHFKKQ